MLQVVLFTFLQNVSSENIPGKLNVHFFGSETCGECAEVKDAILLPMMENNLEEINVVLHDIENDEDLKLLLKYEKYFKIEEGSPLTLILPDTIILGFENIMEVGEELILTYLKNPEKWKVPVFLSETTDTPVDRKKVLDRYVVRKTSAFEYFRDLSMFVIGILFFMFRKKRFSVISSQIIIGSIFIIASFSKIGDPHGLSVIIKSYGILPNSMATLASYVMPWVELLSGISLVLGVMPKYGAGIIFLMNIGFIPSLIYRTFVEASKNAISIFQVGFDCGCGLGENLAWVLIIRDVGFTLMAILILMEISSSWNSILVLKNRKKI